MASNTKRQIPELLASMGESGIASQYLPLSHSICCKLCLSIFNNAKVLPCLHSFCLSCLQIYVRKSPRNLKDRKLLCPTCQEYFRLPGTGIKGLLNNTIIEHSIESNVPTLALRRKQEPLFPGLYTESDKSYEVVVKRQDPNKVNHEQINGKSDENQEWQNFMQLQKSTETDVDELELTENKTSVNISEALKGLSDEERLERLTNSLKNTFSFSQALQDHEVRLESQVRALRTPSSSSEYSFTQRDFLQEQLSSLQTEAMNIIYRLDSIKSSGDTWERCRSHVEHQIHTKVDQIITMVRQAERQLLNKIDSYSENNAPVNPVIEGKQKLQYLLKNILGVIDFVRLILTYGSGRDIEVFEQLVLDRCDNLFSQVISIEKTELAFSNTHVDEEEIEKMIGYLTFSTSSEDIWRYRDNESMVSSESVFTDGKQDLSSTPVRTIPPSFSREFQETMDQLAESECGRSFTPDSLLDDETEQPRLTVDQLIHKFSTEFGMRYNEIVASDSSSRSTPMTSSLTSENPYPSPIPEETNGNGIAEIDLQQLQTRYRPRSHKRRHTVSDVQQDLAHARIDLSDNRYRGLVRSRKISTPDIMATSAGERPLSNDIEQTKRMLALCKRQLLEAKSMGVYNPKGPSTQTSSAGTPENRMSRSASLSRDNSPMADRLSRSCLSQDYLSRSLTDQKLSQSTSLSREHSPMAERMSRPTMSHDNLNRSLKDQRLSQSDDQHLLQPAGHRKSQSIDHGLLQSSLSSLSHDNVHKISQDYVQQIRNRLGMDKPL